MSGYAKAKQWRREGLSEPDFRRAYPEQSRLDSFQKKTFFDDEFHLEWLSLHSIFEMEISYTGSLNKTNRFEE